LGLALAAGVWLVGCLGGCAGKDKGEDKDGFQVAEDGKTIWVNDSIPGEDVPVGPQCIVDSDCPANLPVCDNHSQMCVECGKNDDCMNADRPYCDPIAAVCVQCIMNEHCGSEFLFCLDNKCSKTPCYAGAAKCVGNSVHVCSPDGMDPDYSVIECGELKCVDGNCLECTPGALECKGDKVIQCAADGKSYTIQETCPEGKGCFGGKCLFCYPGNKECSGDLAMVCNIAGSGWDVKEDCSQSGLACYMGACLSPCAGDLKQNTNAGCEFYAVDLDNAVESDPFSGQVWDAQNAQFAVIVSNTSKDSKAEVTVTNPDGSAFPKVTLEPMSLHTFKLDKKWGLDGTEKSKKAFRINSTRPITVYQFNPLSNEQVFSNDASVLLPSPSLGTEYYVMSYRQLDVIYRSYFTVVGVSTIPAQVTFTPTTQTLAGGGIPALAAGQSHTVELGQGDVLHIESDVADGDLTGTHIVSTNAVPIAVFGGHEASNMADQCCADHLEEQMMPVSTWGNHYLIGKCWERWKEQDYVRILASQEGTTVTLNPNVKMVPTLNAGQHFTFQTNVHVEITASKPILVGQYMASSYEIFGGGCPSPFSADWTGQCIGPSCTSNSQCPAGTSCDTMSMTCAPIGDPSLMMAVSEEQFMASYVFLTPDAYVTDYLNVIAPLDAGKVVLDNNQINPASFVPIGGSGFGVFRTVVGDGVHTIWSDKGIGIMVYGYDDDVSYGYPGGMGLVELH
jgi:hypothetical protein